MVRPGILSALPAEPLSLAARPAESGQFSVPDLVKPLLAAHAEDVGAKLLLEQILSAAQLAVWEALDGPLELQSLRLGRQPPPAFSFDAAQVQRGARWAENVYPADREKLRAFLDAPENHVQGRSVDYRLIVGEGELLWVRHWLLERSVTEENRPRLRGLMMAIPEQKQSEWECLRVSEHECNRIGQELHDDLCQVLAGLTFMMRVIGQRAAKFAPDLGVEVEDLNAQLIGATERVRSMAHGLFPAQLNYSTLRHALTEFARQSRTRFRVRLSLDLPRKIPTHTPEQILHVFRVAQEAVSNAVRHGDATEIRLVISPTADGLQMSVEDNGRGFPATAERPEGIGMHTMQYRAHVLGGSLRIMNLSPRGAALRLAYPIALPPPRHNRKTVRT